METFKKMNGRWLLQSSENFDDFMKACGVGMMTRKLGGLAKPSLLMAVTEDGKCQMKIESTLKTSDNLFVLGESFKCTRPDGQEVTAVVTVEGDKLIEVHTASGMPECRFERYLEGEDGLICDCLCNGVKCVRKYKKE